MSSLHDLIVVGSSHFVLSLGAHVSTSFFTNAHRNLSNTQVLSHVVLLVNRLKYFLLVGQVDQNAELTGTLTHLLLRESGLHLHLTGPRSWLFQHFLSKV